METATGSPLGGLPRVLALGDPLLGHRSPGRIGWGGRDRALEQGGAVGADVTVGAGAGFRGLDRDLRIERAGGKRRAERARRRRPVAVGRLGLAEQQLALAPPGGAGRQDGDLRPELGDDRVVLLVRLARGREPFGVKASFAPLRAMPVCPPI